MKKSIMLLIIILLTGCGQSGKLYLPPVEKQTNSVETSHG
jgi:predicted small lipoprotein YifL